jgi:hypothetical protein
MSESLSTVYSWWGGLVLLLVLQALWNLFFSYPAAFERLLRRGRVWVYIPLRWKGFRKLQILLVSRLIVLGIAGTGTWLLVHHTGRHKALWVVGFAALCYAAAAWLQAFWTSLRYRQQEDAYYLLLDELRAKMERENKDFGEAQLRSLSSYQHQQQLRKADEEGRFLAVLGAEARRFRQARAAAVPQTPEP